MTLGTLVFVVLALCAVVLIIVPVMERLGKHWQKPHFRWNRVGGVLAVCSSSDYAKAGRYDLPDGSSLAMVPQTLTFSDVRKGPVNQRFSGDKIESSALGLLEWEEVLGRREKAEDLFVPFTSERYLAFSTQEQVFMEPVANLKKFADRKREQNRKTDATLRYADWARSWAVRKQLDTILIFAGTVGVLSLIAGLLVSLHRAEEARADAEVAIYITRPYKQAVREIHVTQKEADLRSLGSNDEGQNVVRKGRLTSIARLGGGMRLACIQMKGEYTWCGFAGSSRSLKVGYPAYLRPGNVLMFQIKDDDGKVLRNRRENSWWVITEQEALALRGVGFTITE